MYEVPCQGPRQHSHDLATGWCRPREAGDRRGQTQVVQGPADVEQDIRERRSAGDSIASIAEACGLSRATVSATLKRTPPPAPTTPSPWAISEPIICSVIQEQRAM